MATVRSVITLDKEEADVLYKALHSDGAKGILDEIRAALSAPLAIPPTGEQKRATSLTTRVRAGLEITEETTAQIRKAVKERQELLEMLAQVVEQVKASNADDEAAGEQESEVAKLLKAHAAAVDTLDKISQQIKEFAGAQQ
ncbi:hypothetical protein [Lentzea sp. NBRC 102530]|uniref:hypothetical protein n=1 Tax=Lentzea sp. NBRC 102530 TaxID=3032201 RepID=UPI0024A4E7F3|nr:hypothetical protein [Lentzea sp. NBRC 102530]GLY54827.1 hypothetical protein Lesp01_84820 [Lentzea sp. NBRC 102530]